MLGRELQGSHKTLRSACLLCAVREDERRTSSTFFRYVIATSRKYQRARGFEPPACYAAAGHPAHLSRSRERSIHVEQGDDAGVLGNRHGAERIRKMVWCVLCLWCCCSFCSLFLEWNIGFWNKSFYMYMEAVFYRVCWQHSKFKNRFLGASR